MPYVVRWPNYNVFLGVFFMSSATIALEVALTRALSVALWYHFAFMVVSISLLGLGASGSFLSLWPRILSSNINKLLPITSTVFSLSALGSFIAAQKVPFDPVRIAWDNYQFLYILIYYLLLSVPFFASGLTIASVLYLFAARANIVYFFDLCGASSGAILILAAFGLFGGSGAIAFASFLGAIATFLFSLKCAWPVKFGSGVLSLTLLALAAAGPSFMDIRISPYKTLQNALMFPGSKILDTAWNSFSRIDVFESRAVRFAPGLSLNFQGRIPAQLGLAVDGGGLDAITEYHGDPRSAEFTDYLPSAIAYHLIKPEKVLIIGTGGGINLLSALKAGAKMVDAVEPNPLIVALLKGEYARFSGGIYIDPRVKVHTEGGRSFLKKSRHNYDLIEISLNDNPSANTSGLYGLSENYTYTVEAIADYRASLRQGGVFSATRYLLPPPREEVRLVALTIEALESRARADPAKEIAIIRSWGALTFLMKKGGFGPSDIDAIKRFAAGRSFDLVYYPGIKEEETNIYNKFDEPIYYKMVIRLLAGPGERRKLISDYSFDISPVSDDRPFFYHFFKWNSIAEVYRLAGDKWQIFIEGGYLVPVIFFQALLLSAFFIIAPVLLFKRKQADKKGLGRFLVYFFSIGLAYILVEITMIQKLILFLGHPVYAVSAVLFSMLFFSGLGSLASRKLLGKNVGGSSEGTGRPPIRSLSKAIAPVAAILIFYYFFFAPILNKFLGFGFLSRVGIAIGMLAVLAFFMGMPFPAGIRILERLNPTLIPWAWCVNGSASVIGSVLAVIIALGIGFSSVLIISAFLYSAAVLAMAMVPSLKGQGF